MRIPPWVLGMILLGALSVLIRLHFADGTRVYRVASENGGTRYVLEVAQKDATPALLTRWLEQIPEFSSRSYVVNAYLIPADISGDALAYCRSGTGSRAWLPAWYIERDADKLRIQVGDTRGGKLPKLDWISSLSPADLHQRTVEWLRPFVQDNVMGRDARLVVVASAGTVGL